MAAYELKYTAEEIDGILESVDEKTIYSDATQSEHGLMSVEDKTKLDGLPDGEELSEALDSKIEKRVPTTAGNLAKLTGEGNIADSGYRIDDFATEQQGRLADTAYQKPSSGIPKTDLASSVQTSLGKADTALQEHQDISGKQDTLVSGTNIKTVNGESLLGSGNIEIQGGGGGGEENVIEAITMNGASVPVTNKTAAITETDPTVPSWAKQQTKPSYNYSEIGNTPDLSGFITKSVNDLTNYYLKSETYTKAEVAALIGAIQQFHYEIYATLPQSGESNVLYLVGPTGSGSDRYEEYVYSNNTFTKIGDTSIDLSGYVTTSALNTALANYATTQDLNDAVDNTPYYSYVEDEGGVLGSDSVRPFSYIKTESGDVYAIGELNSTGYEDWSLVTKTYVDNVIDGLATVATSGSYNDLDDKPVIPIVPANVSAFTNDAGYLTQHQSLTNYVQKSQTAGLLKNDGTVDTNTYLTQHQDISGKEDTFNKVSTISGNETNTTKYPNTKAVANALGKWGVISQTQTWTQASDGGYDYTMSNLVYGNIPQSNIDLFESAGAVFNATSGYFELNTLTDISYQEMMNIYRFSLSCTQRSFDRFCIGVTNVRTNLPLPWYGYSDVNGARTNHSGTNMFAASNFEVFLMPPEISPSVITTLTSTSAFMYDVKYLKKIINRYMVTGAYTAATFMDSKSLVDVRLNKIINSFNIGSARISKESLLYMINNEAATTNITIKLVSSVYTAMTTDTDIQAALSNHTYITLGTI